ncbi:MAG: D-alanine--D-alanine ligase [Gammaproteobacteria bacterium]|nr:D-alanine--D-alanine ligase [Gammaproteobacteria bacterium]
MSGAGSFGKVAVLMGGQSAEREISLKSGRAVLESLQRQGIDAHALDCNRQTLRQLQDEKFERVFIVLHGRGGEDGTIQGALDSIALPYTGSGVLGSALAMYKLRTKLIWHSCGIPTPPFQILDEGFDAVEVVERLGLPLMIKPIHEGSSIGMSRVESVDALDAAWRAATKSDGAVLAESWVNGAEYTVAILDGEALPPIKLETPNDFYDFDAKYRAETTQYICPCGLSGAAEQRLKKLALEAFAAVEASGWGRVDVMAETEGEFLPIEVNTVPGMTDHSLVPMAAKAAGIDFDQLTKTILAQTLPAGMQVRGVSTTARMQEVEQRMEQLPRDAAALNSHEEMEHD